MLLIALLLACTAGGDSGFDGDPTLRIVTPAADQTVCGDPLLVEIEVTNFELVAPVSDPDLAEPGTGHVDITLNGQDVDMIWDTQADIPGVADGAWQLKAELSNSDHSPVQPYVSDLIYITIDDERCP